MANKKNHYSRLYHLCFEQTCSKLACENDCINEAPSDLNFTIAIATKTSLKPQCGF